jgi:hypothetical protein
MTRHARIYKPVKTAMQSGKNRISQWILQYDSSQPDFTDPLMGWRGSTDTLHQVRLQFPSYNLALAFAQKNNLEIQVEQDHHPITQPKRYSDNFRYDHVE